MQLFDRNRRPLGVATLLDRGGEAEIYQLTGDPFRVAKVYHFDLRTDERQRKLKIMISDPPRDPEQASGHTSIAWPSELVYNNSGDFLGFLMPRIDTSKTRKLLNVYSVSSYPERITWAHLLLVARNLAVAVAALHRKGYVIGDLNESNVLVAQNNLITFVDCDSMQVRESKAGEVFRCTVGKGEYSPPELQGVTFSQVDRTLESDAFALGVLICQILLLGRHPFAGGGSTRVEENIQRQDSFLFARKAQPPAATPPLHVLPPPILDLLIRCFRDGHADPRQRPSSDEWVTALDHAASGLRTCHRSPFHSYGSHLNECPWCRYEKDNGFDPFTYRSQQAPPASASLSRPGKVPTTLSQVLPPTPLAPSRNWTVRAVIGSFVLALVALGYFVSKKPTPLPPPAETPVGQVHRVRDPQHLVGTYTGLLEPSGGGQPVYSILSIRDVSPPSDGVALFHFTLNTLDDQRRDGVGQARLESGLVLLSETETFHVSVDRRDRYVLQGEAGTQLTKERQ